MIGFLCCVPALIVTALLTLLVYAFDPTLAPWAAGCGVGILVGLVVTMWGGIDRILPHLAGNEADDQAVQGRLVVVPEVGLLFVWLWLVFWIIILLRFGLDLRGIHLP